MLQWIQNIVSRINQPFPEKKGVKRVIITAFWIGLFITCFLYFFRPFGFHEPRLGAALFTAIFGLITFTTIVLFDLFTAYVLKLKKDTDKWTLGKWIVETIVLIFFISIGNYFFVVYLVDQTFSLGGFTSMIVSTFILGIFPMVFSGLLIQINAIKQNQKQAESLVIERAEEVQGIKSIRLIGQNDQYVEFSLQELLFIEARSNYVSLTLNRKGNITEESLRSTLKNIESQLSEIGTIRCHRSFLVNPDRVISVTGNAQGLRLTLEGLSDLEIPVSRSYIAQVKERLSA